MNRVAIIGIVFSLMILLSACTLTDVPRNEQVALNASALKSLEHEYQDGDMVTCHLTMDSYYWFIEDPTMDKLTSSVSSITLYRTVDSEADPVERITISNEGTYISQWPSGILRVSDIDRFPVYKSTIEFMGNTSKIESLLKTHGYDCTVIDAVVVTSSELPFLLWARCEEESFLITINEFFYEDCTDDVHSEENVYRIYSPEKFSHKINTGQGDGSPVS